MKIKLRIFLAILIVTGIGFTLHVRWITADLRPQLRGATEEPLADLAWMLASLAGAQAKDGAVDTALFRQALAETPRRITPAPIYDFVKTTMDLRVYMTDAAGRVIFDSAGRDEGADYSRWNDVMLTLQGRYGTRTSAEFEGAPLSTMYVAAPIRSGGTTIGVVSVGKPTWNVNAIFEQSKRKVVLGGLLSSAVMVLVTLVVSAMVVRPIERLTAHVHAVGRGRREAFPELGGGEVGQLGRAFEEMRSALEGKQYVENYVQTLTHEMKSPLAAIQGAVELLREEMPAERRGRFHANIADEVRRMQQVIDRLLLLSSIENKKALQDVAAVDLVAVVRETVRSCAAVCLTKDVDIDTTRAGDDPVILRGEPFLIRQAVANVIQNALDFAPRGTTVAVDIVREGKTVQLKVEDQGPGVPDYALARVFERFYSLNRPDTGRKSSGLGLSVVREAMLLHGGSVSLANRPGAGAVAILTFPVD